MSDVFRQTLFIVCVNPVYYLQQLPLPILVLSRCVSFWLLMQLVKTAMMKTRFEEMVFMLSD